MIDFSDIIIRESGNENVVVMQIDLSSFKSVRDFAAEVLRKEDRLDIIIHNAGYAGVLTKLVSVDGIEMTMATNHYGSFLLTHLLIDLLKKSGPSRIVIVASKNHQISTLDPLSKESLNPIGFFPPFHLYNNSKMANILFCFELARRLKDTNVTTNCLHPGVVDTGIFRNIPFPFNIIMFIIKQFLKNLNEGIQTILYVALSPELNNVSGKFFRDCKESEPNTKVHNKIWWTAMWEASKEIVKLTKDDPQI